jgi:putative hemolysin
VFSLTVALTLGFLVLLALSATFSGSETALFSLDRIQLRRLERSSSRRERVVASLASRPERLLGGILLGNTLVNVAASSVALALTRRLGGERLPVDPVVTSVVVGTLIILFLGEIIPKGIAVHWPRRVALFQAPVLVPVLRVLAPASGVLERFALGFLRGVGVEEDREAGKLQWRELQLLFEEIRGDHEISEDEGEIASNIFAFFETRAYEIMTPRVDVVALSAEASRDERIARASAARHSRYPVYRGTLDHVVGFVNGKDLLLERDAPLETFLRPVHFVPERARLHRVLAEIQARRLSLVVVVNEYGGTAGIISQEDLLEEVVGEIFDEQERDEAPELEPVGEGAWRVNGLVSLTDLGEAMEAKLPESPAETVAGHVAYALGRPPRRGDAVETDGWRFRVLQVRRHRAHRVLVERGSARGGDAQ